MAPQQCNWSKAADRIALASDAHNICANILITMVGSPKTGAARGLTVAEGTSAEIDTLLCPVPVPPAVMCIGLNYKKHAVETGQQEPRNPIVFYKNPSTVGIEPLA